mgnify:CR=1 FL=1
MANNDPPEWKDSAARAHLCDLLMKKQIPAELKPKQVHEQFCKNHATFKVFKYDKNFAARLRYLRTKTVERNDRAARDSAALTADRLIYARPYNDGFGLPLWATSDAKASLCDDIDNNKHKTMTKEALWCSRAECYEFFPFDKFVKHIHQEVKTRKFHKYCKDKADKKIAKKLLKNMPCRNSNDG